MRIGQDDNYLNLTPHPLGDGFFALRVDAVATGNHRRFTSSADRLMIDTDDATLQRLTEFESLQTDEVLFPLSEGGWLRFNRDSHGHVTVNYRIACRNLSAAMEGAVTVEGEFASRFCRDFGRFLQDLR